MVNCNLNYKAPGSSDKIHVNFFPKEMCHKGKAVPCQVMPGCSGGQSGFIRGRARSWVEKTEQVPSGYKILDGVD
jgi:hypothetical protein